MSNAVLIGFNTNGQLIRLRNRLGTDLTAEAPVTPAEMASIRTTLDATATQITLGVVNVLDYGVTGNGVTFENANLATAIAAAQAGSVKELLFPPGTYRLNSITIPAGLTVTVPRGAVFLIEAGQRLTMSATVNAGEYRIFTGPGATKVGAAIQRPKPHWWGVEAQAILQFPNTTVLNPGVNSVSVTWTPDSGTIEWERAPIVRATLLDPANTQSNMLNFWATSSGAGLFTMNVNMIVGVTLDSALSFHLEPLGSPA